METIEQIIDREALKMFDAYYPLYVKKYPRTRSQVYKKFYSYFRKTASLFCIRESFDSEKFIKSQMIEDFKFPTQFPNEMAWAKYQEYLPTFKEKSPEIEIVEKIVNASLELKHYEGMEDWLKFTQNQEMVIEDRMKVSPLLFSFSTTFCDFCKENCPEVYDLQGMRRLVLSQKCGKKLLEKIKEILKNDYVMFYENFKKMLDREGIVF